MIAYDRPSCKGNATNLNIDLNIEVENGARQTYRLSPGINRQWIVGGFALRPERSFST